MFRKITRSLVRFFTAVVLLALILCAVEVGLRGFRVWNQMSHVESQSAETANLLMPSPVSWVDVRPNLRLTGTDRHGRPIAIVTNEFGLRGPSPAVPPPPDTFRILCIGGNALFGPTVKEDETISAFLEQDLSESGRFPIEVLNAGCPNSGPLVNLLRYRHHLTGLQADLILVCLAPEDLQFDAPVRGALRLDEGRKPAYAPHPRYSEAGSPLLDSLIDESAIADLFVDRAGNLTGLQSVRFRKPKSSKETRLSDLAALVMFQELAELQSGSVAVTIAPSIWELGGPPGSSPPESTGSLEKQLREVLYRTDLSARVPVHNALPDFQKAGRNLRSYFNTETGGFTVDGNEYYARVLAAYLRGVLTNLPSDEAIPSGIPRPDIPVPHQYTQPTTDTFPLRGFAEEPSSSEPRF